MLIIDPEVNCARIYTEEYASQIKVQPHEVCKDLVSSLFTYNRDGVMVQIIVPYIVKGGVGDEYIHVLNNMDVTVKTVAPKLIGAIIPKLI